MKEVALVSVPVVLLALQAPAQGLQWFTNPANGHAYALTPSLTWTQAEAQAVSVGGHLATVRSQAEHNWLVQTFGDGNLWLGYSDAAVEGQWLWASGEPTTYTNWASGEPSSGGGLIDEDYCHFHAPSGGGLWNDNPNGQTTFPGIIEWIPHVQPHGWQSVAGGPGARSTASMAFDSATGNVLLTGGHLGLYFYTDTWIWDGVDESWTDTTAASPPRFGAAIAFDHARSELVMFGGWHHAYLGDTFVWDGQSWEQVATTGPAPRVGASMFFDENTQKVVLFGGDGGSTFSDTWVWDGTSWIELFPATAPPARFWHATTFDTARGRGVMFGGSDSSYAPKADTWEWDGSNWQAGFSSTFPLPRDAHTLAFDASLGVTILQGGRATPPFTSSAANPFSDVWAWDGTDWTQLTQTQAPSGEIHGTMAYDAASQRLVHFGGWGNGSPLGETWVTRNAGAFGYGGGCGSPALLLQRVEGSRPIVGTTCRATIENAPTQIAAVAMGFNRDFFGPFQLPVALSSIGMAGCELWHSAEVLGLGVAPTSPTTLGFSYPIPNLPGLVGKRAFIQAYALAPGVNQLQVVSSNGVGWRIGAY